MRAQPRRLLMTWTVVSMKDDWKIIHPFEKKQERGQ